MKSVLIVEDESLVAMEIAGFVKGLGYRVSGIASSAEQAQTILKDTAPDIVLMDIRIKGAMDGINTAKWIKEHYALPVIFLTAYIDEETIERAVDSEPAAYLVKPFNRQELMASLKIALQNSQIEVSKKESCVELDNEFSLDIESKQLYCKNELVHLTKKEQELLEILYEAKNRVVDILSIENIMWPDREPNENRRRAVVSRLRAKLKHKFIETFPAVGYSFVLREHT